MPTIVDSIETLETNIWIWHRNVVNSTNSTNVCHLIELREAGVVWCVGSVVEDGWRTAGSLVTWPLSSSDCRGRAPAAPQSRAQLMSSDQASPSSSSIQCSASSDSVYLHTMMRIGRNEYIDFNPR